MKRSTILSGIAAGAVAFPAVRVRAADALRVLTSPGDSGSTVLYAADRGFFAEHGLDVKVEILANGSVTVPAVVGGSAQFAGTSVTTVAIAHQKGIPLVGVCPSAIYSDRSPTSELMVAKDSPLKTARDLAGKTIAVNGLLTNSHVATMAWIDKNGGDSKASRYLELVYSEMAPALAAGRVDAALIIEPTLTLAKQTTRVFALAYGAIAPRFALGIYATTRTWADANPDVARRFYDAMADTVAWATAHPKESLEILAHSMKLEPAALANVTRAIYAAKIEVAEIQPIIDVSVKYGALATSFPAKDIIWP